MTASTRQQAKDDERPQDDNQPSEDKDPESQGENGEKFDETPRPAFDQQEPYHPVFCLTEVPGEYMNELMASTSEDETVHCLEITSNSPFNTLEEIKANLAQGARPTPFRGCTIDQVYAFYKAHLCPDENYAGPGMHFTSFTFLAVDDACLRADPRECILCSDSPDFGEAEGEIVLKQLRLPLNWAIENLSAQETLLSTMSTINHPSGLSVSIQPSPTFMPTPEGNGLFKVATASQARENKRRAIAPLKSADDALGRGLGEIK